MCEKVPFTLFKTQYVYYRVLITLEHLELCTFLKFENVPCDQNLQLFK